ATGPGSAPRSKRTPYEGGTRQPIIFTWPGTIPPQRRETYISSIDIAPTILSAAGALIPDNLPGVSLMPLMCDNMPLDRDAIFGETFAHDIADLDDLQASLLYRWIIAGRWKLILTYDGVDARHPSRHADEDPRPQRY